MLTKFTNNSLEMKCTNCSTDYSHTLNGEISTYQADWGEYKNFVVNPCPSCDNVEVLNMNIPTDEMQEYNAGLEDLMPYPEINQRKYVRDLIKAVREDFQV